MRVTNGMTEKVQVTLGLLPAGGGVVRTVRLLGLATAADLYTQLAAASSGRVAMLSTTGTGIW